MPTNAHDPCLMKPIGVIHSPHVDAKKTPIQPVYAEGIPGRVEIDPPFLPGLKDLDGFSHIYLLYVFHQAGELRLTVRPFLEDAHRGLFSTRAPVRPNPIGLSIVRLVRIEGRVLHVEDVDILDGTPLLDIKPYTRRFDDRLDVRCGWQESIDEETARIRGRRGYRPPE